MISSRWKAHFKWAKWADTDLIWKDHHRPHRFEVSETKTNIYKREDDDDDDDDNYDGGGDEQWSRFHNCA